MLLTTPPSPWPKVEWSEFGTVKNRQNLGERLTARAVTQALLGERMLMDVKHQWQQFISCFCFTVEHTLIFAKRYGSYERIALSRRPAARRCPVNWHQLCEGVRLIDVHRTNRDGRHHEETSRTCNNGHIGLLFIPGIQPGITISRWAGAHAHEFGVGAGKR